MQDEFDGMVSGSRKASNRAYFLVQYGSYSWLLYASSVYSVGLHLKLSTHRFIRIKFSPLSST